MLPLLGSKQQVEQAAMIFVAAAGAWPEDQPLPPELVKLSLALFIAYRDGTSDGTPEGTLAPDEEKALHYLALALFLKPPISTLDFLITFFGWFTSVRLATVRGNRLLSVDPISSYLDSHLDHPHPDHKYSLTGGPYSFFSTLQLSYGPELLVCLIKLLTKAFRPETKDDRDKTQNWPWLMQGFVSLYYRFDSKRANQLLQNREFRKTVFNAIVWLFVNVIVYIGFPALGWQGAMLNLCAFAYDIWHDYRYTNQELNDNKNLRGVSNPLQQNNSISEPLISTLNNLLTILNVEKHKTHVENALDKKITTLTDKRFRVTCVAIGIFIGMALFYTPFLLPQLPAIFQMAGAYTVFGTGVVWGGLGAKLRGEYDKKNRLQSVLNILYSGLPYLCVAVGFYFASSFFSVPVLIMLAWVGSGLPALWQKNSTRCIQEDTFEIMKANTNLDSCFPKLNLLQKNPLKDTEVKAYSAEPPPLQTDNALADGFIIDIEKFSTLKLDEKNALRVVSGISDDKQWLELVTDLSRESKDRRITSTDTLVSKILKFSNTTSTLQPARSKSLPPSSSKPSRPWLRPSSRSQSLPVPLSRSRSLPPPLRPSRFRFLPSLDITAAAALVRTPSDLATTRSQFVRTG